LGNTILIAMQKPDATLVAGYTAWKNQFENNPPEIPVKNNHVGSYRKEIMVPAAWKGKQIVAHFGSVTSNIYLWVNGRFVGYSEDSKLEAEFDLTPYLKAGQKNLIAFQVFRWCDGTYLEDQDFFRYCGVARESYLYALAYGNDKGGYELRSSFYKGGTRPKGVTTHLSRENAPVVVFEGFFDMLSFATLCGGVKHNYVVLNSIVNAPDGIEVIKNYESSIYLCLDNDNPGREATLQMKKQLPLAQDISYRFARYKDVNDYLMNNSTFASSACIIFEEGGARKEERE